PSLGVVHHADSSRTLGGRPEYARAPLEASVQCLGLEYVDLYGRERDSPCSRRSSADGESLRSVGGLTLRARRYAARSSSSADCSGLSESVLWPNLSTNRNLPFRTGPAGC